MTSRRFATLLRTRGAALDLWPPPLDEEARRLLAHSMVARMAYRRALQAETTMAAALPDPIALSRMQAGLQRRLAASPARRLPPPMRSAMPWGALAACFLAGLMIGLAGLVPGPSAPPDALPDAMAELHISPILMDAR